MSYEIIKGLSVRGVEVWIKSSSNNVSPRTYNWWHCTSLTSFLKEHGKTALDIEILKQYENGNFQPGTKNKYSRAAERLKRMPEYANFNWRCGGMGEEYDAINQKRKTDEFNTLLLKALNGKDNREPCIIVNNFYNPPVFVKKVNRRRIPYTRNKDQAKRFDYPDLAQHVINSINAPSENFAIQTV